MDDTIDAADLTIPESPQARAPKRQRPTRTALACTFCRQRKARCSGDWPTCTACESRGRKCTYPGRSSPSTLSRGPLPLECTPDENCLPSESLRRRVISYFRVNYAPTLLCFFPPQQLIEDEIGKDLPLSLFLCIIALVSRFIPEFTNSGKTITEVSDHYADLARSELGRNYDEPSLITIQCCLVLCILEIGEGAEHRGWLRLGHATRLAQLLQLHNQDTDQRHLDWGSSTTTVSIYTAESRRRTFWCCFCLDKLFANGRDRIAILSSQDITTRLPVSDEDFIYGRKIATQKLNSSTSDSGSFPTDESLFTYTIRIVDILAKVMSWHGRGGRHNDSRCPWLVGMPYKILDDALQQWKSSIPTHFDYTPQNCSIAIATGQGRLWCLMFMLYFQARAYLHREYLPFTPKQGYDPVSGPCDGPALVPTDSVPPEDFWPKATSAMIESANAISDLYTTMVKRQLEPSAYPIPGLGLLTAASIHVMYSIFGWDSMQSSINEEASRKYLQQDMEGFNHLGQRWDLAVHWVRQISLYYRLNRLTKRSWTNDRQEILSTMNIREVKDGVMNYVRQIGQQDRATRQLNFKPTFDFEGWLSVIEHSISDNPRNGLGHYSQRLEGESTDAPTYIDVDGLQNLGAVGGFDDIDSLAIYWQDKGPSWMEGWNGCIMDGWDVSSYE